VHGEAVVLMGIGIVKHQYIVPFRFSQSRQAVYLYFLFFRSIPNVENSGSHDGFVYQNVATGLQCGLHGIGKNIKREMSNKITKKIVPKNRKQYFLYN
jgi:hypothetical protein